ncbi:NAD(P)H-hydrate dehydratase [Candidatus Woesearchaeota archaeon]|nr:NAD(P)H-hydrate dehydratase [Candidatus Woesearchaeota archaeon]
MRVTRKDITVPEKAVDAHKGDHGRLLIVGGSEEFAGAPILAGLAAFRSGVDLVEVAAPRKVSWAANAKEPSLITHKLKCMSFSKAQVKRVLELSLNADAVLVGNGLGRTRKRLGFVRELLNKLDKPVVVDADALYAADLRTMKSRNVVFTPHEGEFAALCEASNVDAESLQSSLDEGRVVLLKRPVDHILTNQETWQNATGTPRMAVAGTGDVLAGFCAGLLAQGLTPEQASVTAAYLVGKAGEEASREVGNFTAEEMTDYL